MLSLSRIVSAVVTVGLGLSVVAPAAGADDPAARRRQVETERAQAAQRLNVLRASQAQIQRALVDLDGNVRGQQAAVESATQAMDAAAVALEEARRTEAEKAAEVARLRTSAAQVALDAYVGTSTAAMFDALRSGSLTDIARRRAYVSYAMGNTSDTLDQLRAARQDLQAQRRAAQRAKDQTAARRTQVVSRLGALTQAQRQQMRFAGQVENR